MAEYAHLSEPDPELAPQFASLPPFDITPEALPTIRKGFEEVGISLTHTKWEPHLPSSSEYKVADHQIDVGGGITVRARSIVPVPRDGEDGIFPLLFWLHGGGFVIGTLDMDDDKTRIASVKQRISIVNCEYRLAPEHRFPAAVDDAKAGLKYVASHPELFSASLKKGFIVGGLSAGGNLASVLALLARDDPFFKDKPLTGQLLVIPATVHFKANIPEKYKSSLLSLEQNKDAPILNMKNIAAFMDMYQADPNDPRMSPLLASSHKGLPPAFIQICGLDPLRDEAFLYEKILKEAGVKTNVEVYPGTPHGFESSFFESKQAAKSREDFNKGIEWLLQVGRG